MSDVPEEGPASKDVCSTRGALYTFSRHHQKHTRSLWICNLVSSCEKCFTMSTVIKDVKKKWAEAVLPPPKKKCLSSARETGLAKAIRYRKRCEMSEHTLLWFSAGWRLFSRKQEPLVKGIAGPWLATRRNPIGQAPQLVHTRQTVDGPTTAGDAKHSSSPTLLGQLALKVRPAWRDFPPRKITKTTWKRPFHKLE